MSKGVTSCAACSAGHSLKSVILEKCLILASGLNEGRWHGCRITPTRLTEFFCTKPTDVLRVALSSLCRLYELLLSRPGRCRGGLTQEGCVFGLSCSAGSPAVISAGRCTFTGATGICAFRRIRCLATITVNAGLHGWVSPKGGMVRVAPQRSLSRVCTQEAGLDPSVLSKMGAAPPVCVLLHVSGTFSLWKFPSYGMACSLR